MCSCPCSSANILTLDTNAQAQLWWNEWQNLSSYKFSKLNIYIYKYNSSNKYFFRSQFHYTIRNIGIKRDRQLKTEHSYIEFVFHRDDWTHRWQAISNLVTKIRSFSLLIDIHRNMNTYSYCSNFWEFKWRLIVSIK